MAPAHRKLRVHRLLAATMGRWRHEQIASLSLSSANALNLDFGELFTFFNYFVTRTKLPLGNSPGRTDLLSSHSVKVWAFCVQTLSEGPSSNFGGHHCLDTNRVIWPESSPNPDAALDSNPRSQYMIKQWRTFLGADFWNGCILPARGTCISDVFPAKMSCHSHWARSFFGVSVSRWHSSWERNFINLVDYYLTGVLEQKKKRVPQPTYINYASQKARNLWKC